MKKFLIILSVAAVIAAACDPIPEYATKKVEIEMQLDAVSAGFIQATFIPSKPAYYAVSFDKVRQGVDPQEYKTNFMELVVDSLYVEYVQWRYSHLMKGEKYVADFASHSLKYGKTTYTQHFLEPDTDYWMYCFVVDPTSNKPVGDLFCEVVRTTSESIFDKISFAYRVEGYWDYVYPFDRMTGDIAPNVPWVGETVDSLTIRELDYRVPGEYFDERFKELGADSRILTGIYAHLNDGKGDGTSDTLFEEGHTYYTAAATFDGKRNDCFVVYRFRWDGPDTELVFTDEDSTGGAW